MTLVLALLGCTLSPPAVADWKAEIATESRIGEDADFDGPRLMKGRIHVLVLSTEWGDLPIITDTEKYLNVLISLPMELEPGATFSAANRRGYLRIGGMDIGYESRELDGTIHVVETTPTGAVLDLDLFARTPVIDLHERGEQHIVGRVTAVFRPGPTN